MFLIWLRVVWQVTVIPVGRWTTRTAESVVFTPWPPGPEARITSMRSSSGLSTTSTSSSTSGITSTPAKEVWRRPEASKGEGRTRRCTPASGERRP